MRSERGTAEQTASAGGREQRNEGERELGMDYSARHCAGDRLPRWICITPQPGDTGTDGGKGEDENCSQQSVYTVLWGYSTPLQWLPSTVKSWFTSSIATVGVKGTPKLLTLNCNLAGNWKGVQYIACDYVEIVFQEHVRRFTSPLLTVDDNRWAAVEVEHVTWFWHPKVLC